jgi:hypothetical protein
LIVEGLVFRVVTASSPGDPSLKEFGCVRTEFLAWDFGWTCDRDQALRFPTHLAANLFAAEQQWHAMVVSPPLNTIPEQLAPATPPALQVLPPPLPAPARKKKHSTRAVVPLVSPPRRQSWVNEVYG